MDPNELRERTRSEHEAVESVMPLMQEGLTRELYVHVLRCLYPVVHGWETWALEGAPGELLPLVQARRRSALLADDLRFWDGAADYDSSAVIEALNGLAADKSAEAYAAVFLGAMYVMEGSTLGGQYIARHVEETLGLTTCEGDAYFRGYGEQTGAMWMEFKKRLGSVHQSEAEHVIEAAKAMFGVFGDALRGCLAV